MYVYAKSKKDLRLTIDWGDGIVEDMSEKTGSDIRFLDYGPDYDYSGVIILHKYEGDFVNRKNVVTIYGDQYFMCRGYYYGLAPYFPGKQLRNIISRAFAEDLPVAVNLKNVSSLANESDRVLKLSVPYGYRNAITNCSNAFINCINLLEAAVSEDSIGGNPMYSDSNLFMGCSSLTASTYRIPPYFTIGGTQGSYYGCAALSADVKNLLPKGGFYSADAQRMKQVFYGCKGLYGELPVWMKSADAYRRFLNANTEPVDSLPELPGPEYTCKLWMSLPAISAELPDFEAIGKAVLSVSRLPETGGELGAYYYIPTSYSEEGRTIEHYTFHKCIGEEDGKSIYEQLPERRYRNIYFLTQDTTAVIKVGNTLSAVDVSAGTKLYVDVLGGLRDEFDNPYTGCAWSRYTARCTYLNTKWTGPDGQEYPARALYEITEDGDDWRYDTVFYVGDMADTQYSVNGDIYRMGIEPYLRFIEKPEGYVGDLFSRCSEEFLSAVPRFLGGTLPNPQLKTPTLNGISVDLSISSQVDVISRIIKALGGTVLP